MKIRPTIISLFLFAGFAGQAFAEEILAPDILNRQPQRSIDADMQVLPEQELLKVDEKPPVILKSMLFDAKSAAELEAIMPTYKQALISKLSQATMSEDITGESPLQPIISSIYLGAILYKDKNDILAWVNGKKHKLNEKVEDITIVAATSGTATLVWDLTNYNFNFENENLAKNPLLVVDKEKRQLKFTIKQNHRLDMDSFKFFAGKNYVAPKLPGITDGNAPKVPLDNLSAGGITLPPPLNETPASPVSPQDPSKQPVPAQ